MGSVFRSPPKVNQFFPSLCPITPNVNEISSLLLQQFCRQTDTNRIDYVIAFIFVGESNKRNETMTFIGLKIDTEHDKVLYNARK